MNCLSRRKSGNDFLCSNRRLTIALYTKRTPASCARKQPWPRILAWRRNEEPIADWAVTKTGTVRVTTTKAAYEAEHLVIAPGAWASKFLKLPDLPLHVRRHVMAWFDPVDGIAEFKP